MNWRRGLFRVWAVAAVLWIAGTTWLQWREIRCAWEPSRQGCNASDQWADFKLVPADQLPPGFVLDPKPEPWAVVSQTPIDLSKLSNAQVIALHNAGGDFTKLTDEMRKSILTSLGAGGGRQAERVVSPAPPRYDKLMDDAGTILGPPLLLLLVGGLLYWAIRGFRGAAR
jgi:hypothetical protein